MRSTSITLQPGVVDGAAIDRIDSRASNRSDLGLLCRKAPHL